jgi:hypothetical protein
MARMLVLCALLAAGAAHAAPLTVVAFNVQSDNSSDVMIGRQLERSSGVDLWGLNEIYRGGGWVEPMRVAAGVGEGADFGAVVGTTGRGNESLILYRADRLELLGSEELTGVAGGRNDAAPLVARFRLDGRDEFLFVLVRLSHREKARAEQAARLAEWGAAQTLPVVAAGTFAFEVPEGGTRGDEAMAALTSRTGWEWVRPADAFATACGNPRYVQDFVFAGGAARGWAGQADVTFRQSNYCSTSESNRKSGHRPVIAGFQTDGGPGAIVGVLPDRQIGPLLPATIGDAEVREAREEVAQPALVSEAGKAPPVVEAGAPVPSPAAGSAEPSPAPAAPADSPPLAPPAPEPPASDPEREALLERLEALEREAQEIRRELEQD